MLGAAKAASDEIGHVEFWVAVTTTAPVLFLTFVVEFRAVARRTKDGFERVLDIGVALGVAFFAGGVTFVGLGVLAGTRSEDGHDRGNATRAIMVLFVLLAITLVVRVRAAQRGEDDG